MAPKLTEDEIDDLLYFARIGDKAEFNALEDELRKRESVSEVQLLEAAKDEESGNGILHMAAANGHSDLLREVCKSLYAPTGPQNEVMLKILNAQNKAGNTALHWAALNGHLEAVKVLLEEGSDPTITNQRGHDAVYEAELNDKTEVVEWVLKEGGEGLESGVAGGETGEGKDVPDEEMGDDETLTEGAGGDRGESSKKLEKKLGEMGI
ncbi:ankyrin [Hyaloscypha variabilis]